MDLHGHGVAGIARDGRDPARSAVAEEVDRAAAPQVGHRQARQVAQRVLDVQRGEQAGGVRQEHRAAQEALALQLDHRARGDVPEVREEVRHRAAPLEDRDERDLGVARAGRELGLLLVDDRLTRRDGPLVLRTHQPVVRARHDALHRRVHDLAGSITGHAQEALVHRDEAILPAALDADQVHGIRGAVVDERQQAGVRAQLLGLAFGGRVVGRAHACSRPRP